MAQKGAEYTVATCGNDKHHDSGDTEASTSGLTRRLIESVDVHQYVESMPGYDADLPRYLAGLAAERGMSRADVIRASGVNATFCYQIFSGDRRPGRDTCLSLEAAMEVRDPHVARVLSVGRDGADVVVELDWVEGETLARRVAAERPMSARDAYDVAFEVLEGLDALHRAGVLHRDVTPSNIVLSGRGAVLIDPGICRTNEGGGAKDTCVLGTWGYAAPEQYGFAPTDERSDLYSVSRVFLYMLSATEPEDVDARLMGVLESAWPHTMEVVGRMGAFEPSKSYATCREAACALRLAEAADGVMGQKAAKRTPAEVPAPRRLTGAAVLAFGILLGASFAFIGLTQDMEGVPRWVYGLFCTVFALLGCCAPAYIVGSAIRGRTFFSAEPMGVKRMFTWLAVDALACIVALVVATYLA